MTAGRWIGRAVHNPYGRGLILIAAVLGVSHAVTRKVLGNEAAGYFMHNLHADAVVPVLLKTTAVAGILLPAAYLAVGKWLGAGGRGGRERAILAYLPLAALFPVALAAGWVTVNYYVNLFILKYALALSAAVCVALYWNDAKIVERAERACAFAARHPGAIALAYFGYASLLTVLRHVALHTHGFDLGFFDQVVWRLSQGDVPLRLAAEKEALVTSLHVSPILLLPALLYRLWASPAVLLVAQSGLLALGGWFLMKTAGRELKSPLFLALVPAAYFGFPYLWQANLFDFHEMAFGVPAVLALYWALTERKYALSLGIGLLYLLCREDAFIYLTGFSAVRLLVLQAEKGDRREMIFHAIQIAVAVAYGALIMKFVAPGLLVNPVTGQGLNLTWFGHLGGTIREIAAALTLNWPYLGRLFFQDDRYIHLLRLLAALGFVPLLSPGCLAVALIPIAVLLFSRYDAFIHFSHQYPLLFIPFLLAAYLFGLRRLERLTEKRAAWRWPVFVFLLIIAAVNVHWIDLIPELPSRHALAVGRCLGRIPRAAALSAQNELIPHASQRERIYHYPDLGRAEYVFLDEQGSPWPQTPGEFAAGLETLKRSAEFELVCNADGYLLFKKRPVASLNEPSAR